ncbi:MAG: sigma-70 family RNA polymerase sigma factor [Actinobacteria bacterium]|nr:sigma-70 family RNA polymerase sigma factor [Actinomycetota bacterium]
METEDIQLVRAAQIGDFWAFEELVRRHGARVYRIALRLLGNRSEAEDAAQEAFVQAWQALPVFRGESSVSTWLYRIVTNRCLNLLQARRREEPLSERQEAPTPVPERVAETVDALGALKTAILRLTPEQRAPLVLREFEGRAYEEIAEILEISVPAVKGRLHRARLELLDSMRQWR